MLDNLPKLVKLLFLSKEILLNDSGVNRFFNSLPEFPVAIPIIKELAVLGAKANWTDRIDGIIKRRMERRHLRLCRLSGELGRLDFKKAPADMPVDDYIFSQIDFSAYREINEKYFETFFPESLTDFSEDFFKNNFRLGREEIKSVIEKSYKKAGGFYWIQKENPLILSLMRSLDTSLEESPLFTAGEISGELENIRAFTKKDIFIPDAESLYPILVSGLDNVCFSHDDGMTTRLFISPQGDLSGTFRPGNKPWTRVLITGRSQTDLPSKRAGG